MVTKLHNTQFCQALHNADTTTLMTQELKKFIAEYIHLSDNELNIIAIKFNRKIIKKNDYYLRQGETCKDLVFVQSGCLRMFFIKDGVEISVWFAFPNSVASEIYSFISQKPSGFFVQAIQDSEVLYLPKSKLNTIYETHPAMQELMRKFWEEILLYIIDRFSSLQNDTAEQRYVNLMKNPEYLLMIPQKYLASFIGITPTSFSRIRYGALNNQLFLL